MLSTFSTPSRINPRYKSLALHYPYWSEITSENSWFSGKSINHSLHLAWKASMRKIQEWNPVSNPVWQLSARGSEETFNNMDQWEISFVAVRRVCLRRSAVPDTEVPGYCIHYRTRSSQFNSLRTGKTTQQGLTQTEYHKYRVKRRVCIICQLYSLRSQSVWICFVAGFKHPQVKKLWHSHSYMYHKAYGTSKNVSTQFFALSIPLVCQEAFD